MTPSPLSVAPSPPSALPTPTPSARAALKKFTFPDGHVSFSYPAGWTVRVVQAPYLDEAGRRASREAILADAAGNDVASITSGMYGDGAAGSVVRTVLDTEPVPGLVNTAGEQAAFGFIADEVSGYLHFSMGIRRGEEFTPGFANSGSPQFLLPNGALVARVIFEDVAFPGLDAARAWMRTGQYAQFRALLLSVRYG